MHSLLPLLLCAAQQGSIHVTAELHADPLRDELDPLARRAMYEDWLGWTNDTLDQIDPAVRVSFLMSGEFAEFVIDDGASGDGAELLRRIHGLGGQLGTHFHEEYRVAEHDWDVLSGSYTLEDARRCWTDNVEMVDDAVRLALGIAAGVDVRFINGVIGTHVPDNVSADFRTLMDEYGFHVRQPGPCEDAYQYFSHYMFHPVQPSDGNALVEVRGVRFVEVPAGAGIGRAGHWHHGVWNDFSLAAAQAQFVLELMNWRHAIRTRAEPKVWSFGIVSQPQYQEPGHEEEIGWKGMLQWIHDEIEPIAALAGREIVEYDTEYGVARDYLAWRRANPAAVSMSYAATTTDWDEYPWLAAAARELAGAHLVERADFGDDRLFVWEMEVAGRSAALCWREGADAAADLSGIFGPFAVRVVDVESDAESTAGAASVTIGRAPVVVKPRR